MTGKINLEFKNNILYVRVVGDLDHHSSQIIRKKVEPIIDEYQIVNVVFNLENVTFIDSSGIGVILGRYKQVVKHGGQVVVCNLSPHIERLFKMSAIFDIISQVKNEESAMVLLG